MQKHLETLKLHSKAFKLHSYKSTRSRSQAILYFSLLLRFIRLDENSFVGSWCCNFHARTNSILNYLVSRWRKKPPWIQNMYFQWNTPALQPSWLVTFVWNKIYISMLSSSARLVGNSILETHHVNVIIFSISSTQLQSSHGTQPSPCIEKTDIFFQRTNS